MFAVRRSLQVSLSVLLLAAAVIASICLPYAGEIRRSRVRVCHGSVIANTTAGPIEYAERGSGFPLLSIHGAGGGFDQGLANVADLVDDGFHIIAPSRFGYLRTPVPPNSSPAAQAAAHAALLSKLNIHKAVVLGISAGARSALEFALRYPNETAALILIVPGTYAPDSPVAVEGSRASRFVLWLVNNGADFVWWAAEKMSPGAHTLRRRSA